MCPSEPTGRNPRYPDVTVKLSGTDGNAFAVIGKVRNALRKSKGLAVANAWVDEAVDCKSYDDMLVLCMKTVVVE